MGKINPDNKMDGTIIKIAINMACCCVRAIKEINTGVYVLRLPLIWSVLEGIGTFSAGQCLLNKLCRC